MKWIALAMIATCAHGACTQLLTDKLRVGDLARALPAFERADPSQVISFSPVPGVQRVFSPRELVQLGRRFQVQVDPAVTTNICFERESAPLSKDLIAATILATLNRADVDVEVTDFGHGAYPQGQLLFSVKSAVRPQALHPDEPTVWRGLLKTEQGQTFDCWAKVRLTAEGQRVVATRQLNKGEIVKDGDVALAVVKYSPLFDPYLASLDHVAGKLLRHDIGAGDRLETRDLEDPREVSKGDLIHVTSGTGQALISFEAEAQTGGRKGDTILVQNPINGRSFKGRIVGKGDVQALAGTFY